MKPHLRSPILTTVFISLLLCAGLSLASASTTEEPHEKNAIILASFGTTVPTALESIIHIRDAVRAAYPGTEVRLTFTSNIIRSIWNNRQEEPRRWLDQGVPEEILYVKNVISTVGDLIEEGYTNFVVQPTHMFYMEQSYDLQQYVKGLDSIETMKKRWKPISKIVMGRPALGMPGNAYPYHEDVETVCKTLAPDVEKAKKAGAALVYMGHGNEYWSTGIYAETEKKMREMYPEVKTFIGVVEGSPSLEDVLQALDRAELQTRKILLKPFMIVAGDHATNDMAGDEEDSWKSVLSTAGYSVQPELTGLGSNDDFARIFADHIADAARDANIPLR